ncbi:MAG: hypothetical protein Q8R97_00090, partial [Brevundimonas sp.]|nr:hypothetical protein [Brevundimonas sp.]
MQTPNTKNLVDMTCTELKAQLKLKKVPFTNGDKKSQLIRMLNDANTTNPIPEARAPSATRALYTLAEAPTHPLEQLQYLHQMGVLSDTELKEQSLKLINGNNNITTDVINITPSQTSQVISISETGEKKKEFMETRKRLVGEFDHPMPSRELSDFIRTFATSRSYHTNPTLREHFNLLIGHYEHYFAHVTDPKFNPSNVPLNAEPFLQDYRIFLGHMAALFLIDEM